MAYDKKGGCVPITAKIQKGTQGGVTQPILNVGTVAKEIQSKEHKNKLVEGASNPAFAAAIQQQEVKGEKAPVKDYQKGYYGE
jgi:hypothetical protein